MNMKNSNVLIVQTAISSFRKGDYESAKASYIKASKIFGEHLFINNIKICDLRLQQLNISDLSNTKTEKFNLKEVLLEKEQFHLITELTLLDSEDLLELRLVSEEITPNVKFLVLFDFFDLHGNFLEKVSNIGVSSAYKKYFKYFVRDSVLDSGRSQYILKTHFPENAYNSKIYISTVGLMDNDSLLVNLEGQLIRHNNSINVNAQNDVSLPLYIDDNQTQNNNEPIVRTAKKRTTKDLKVACILDEFTTECLDHEVNLIKITQENWIDELKSQDIDFLLVESCWKGNDGNWGTLTKGSGGGGKLGNLLKFCKKHGIPTVFWNKEDPPHYDKFSPVAKMFDHVITTDINMIPFYKKDHGIEAYPLSFAAQPKIHAPDGEIKRLSKAVFAGSYYGDKPKRCSDFNYLMRQLRQANIDYDIYDRNYHRDIGKFKFPNEYKKNIVGNLPACDVWKAHQGYKYQINMNTVQDSKTMFARRVYESLASGTPVISNASIGVEELFGDVVLFSEPRAGLVKKLKKLEKSPEEYNKLAKLGVRKVMRKHTYAHRIQEICTLLDISVEIEYPKSIMSVAVGSESEIDKALSIFSEQTAIDKHLYLVLDNFESAHTYLNKSNEEVSFVMSFAKELYAEQSNIYHSERVLEVEIGSQLEKEALEDFTYWGRI